MRCGSRLEQGLEPATPTRPAAKPETSCELTLTSLLDATEINPEARDLSRNESLEEVEGANQFDADALDDAALSDAPLAEVDLESRNEAASERQRNPWRD